MTAHRPRKRFGQHFLKDPAVIDAIVRSIAPQRDDVVVEIGPGLGALTSVLAGMSANVHAVEFDRDLVALLKRAAVLPHCDPLELGVQGTNQSRQFVLQRRQPRFYVISE